MDALVYEDTPLATYFEGEAVPYDLPRELTPPHTPFAPRLPDFTERLDTIRKSATSISPTSAEQLLERFRYVIVASQLLSDEVEARNSLPDHEVLDIEKITIRGVLATAALSFSAAWMLHWIKTRKRKFRAVTWFDVGVYCVGVLLLAGGITLFAQRQYTNYLQKSAVRTISKFVDDSHSFDGTAGNVLRFIQEVEVVARGYELGSPLPPVSRLEERQAVRRCRTLRSELATSLRLLTLLLVESHSAVQPYVNKVDVQRYHDIYEVSTVEYSQATELADSAPDDEQDSLRELRFSLRLHAIARKVLLCDLLALKSTNNLQCLRQWRSILRIVIEIEGETATRQQILTTHLASEEWGGLNIHNPRRRSCDASSQAESQTSDDQNFRTQTRRFDEVTHAVRSLNAKVHLMKEEINGLTNSNTEQTVVATSMARHYDSLGSDIRDLLSEWERGKSAMLLHVDKDYYNRSSNSSSGILSPVTPTSSVIGNLTAEGGPSDAFRLLNGDDKSFSPLYSTFDDEEVFEAVAMKPSRRNMSVSGMTREEKIARMAEDRRKRATMQDQAQVTTNMLRELQMVIKHRPKGSISAKRVTSI